MAALTPMPALAPEDKPPADFDVLATGGRVADEPELEPDEVLVVGVTTFQPLSWIAPIMVDEWTVVRLGVHSGWD